MLVASLLLYAAVLAAAPDDAVHAQQVKTAVSPPERPKEGVAPDKEKAVGGDEKPVVTRHRMTINGKELDYTATAGMLPLNTAAGEAEAQVFFVAYTAENRGNTGKRPLLFAFNGGPGSSSVWLHLGAIGPKRVQLPDDGSMPPPPYRLTDNAETWLDVADLVFVDPVGTGYSRAVKPDQATKFFSLQGDIDSLGEFIRLYLTRYGRWSSPLFLAGESYGTMRAAGLAGHLIDRGIAFNGLILVSTVLNFSTISFVPGHDLPYALFLPAYTATAWFHKKLPPDLARDLPAALAEAETWALSTYLPALAKGDRLTAPERQEVARRLARYSGIDERYILNSNLRVDGQSFAKELLRGENLLVGRFDSRLTGGGLDAVGENPEYDPSLTAIRPAFSATLNDYIRGELGYKSDREYYILGGGVGRWDWNTSNSFADTSGALRSALSKNPAMKVLVASGTFDLATPYFSTEYTLNHLALNPGLTKNITSLRYEAGHMMYTDTRARAQLKQDAAAFIRASSPP